MAFRCLTELFRRPLILSGLAVAGFGLVTGTAQAQQDEAVEEITVTGSRIARDPNLTGALPIQSVDAEEIQLSGEFSITDVVNDIPALLTSTSGEQSNNQSGAFEDGTNVLNLRGLGSERTLVLVNGRRHVGGVQGTASVDVGSIPMALIERVEVLSGGASAIYGADAVTGVVNFITKDNYEGFGIDVNYGVSSDGDGQQTSIAAIWGTNFADDRGNIAIAVDWRTDDGLDVTDRSNGTFIGSGRDWVNPERRFQQGEIGASTPAFQQFYNYFNTGLTDFGLAIPTSADDFVQDYFDEFGVTPVLTPEELALIDRAANAAQRAVLPGRTFPFTSGYGYIIPGNPFTFDGFDAAEPIDLDNNGRPDCLDSWTGYNTSLTGAAAFGVIGGCWNVDAAGNYSVVQDGLVASSTQGFGGNSFNTISNEGTNLGLGIRPSDILLPDDKVTVNLLTSYDVSNSATVFAELKYSMQETDTPTDPNSFWDLLFGAPDNPYLPAFIQPAANAYGGVAITIDPLGFQDVRSTERDTTRVVAGVKGEFDNSWQYEVSANYGLFEQRIERTASMINDRFFAAIDVTTDGSGNPICRADLDPNAPAQNTPFEIPAYEAGYFSYTPGSGDCVPLNIWSGAGGISQAARDWVTVPTWDDLEIEQFVLNAFVTGDTGDYFEMPAGAVAFAFGAEYRDESSDARFDDWQRGVIPPGSPFPAGTMLDEVSANSSLTFRPQIPVVNERGSFDVWDVFLEASLPLLADVPGARELTLDAAIRYSDYSSIGDTTTWKTNLVWAPMDTLAFRGGYSEAVRAPNVTELFGPLIGTTFRPVDPCDAAQIQAIADEDPTLAANTQANCVQDFQSFGLDPFDANGNYVFADPLTASFGGVTGGNPDLTEETAKTITAGFVWQPEFIEGLSLTVDYWDISINDAIEAVTSQNIVDGCYQAGNLVTTFCDLFDRNEDPNSAQYGGFVFLRSVDINFAKVETNGLDFSAKYAFEVGAHGFDVTLQGTSVDEINLFQNPSDLTEVNPELGEIQRPEFSGNVFLSWEIGGFRLGWQSQYQDEQLMRFVEVETAEALYGDGAWNDDFWLHDINARYRFNDQLTVYGGIKNLTDEEPFITDRAFPVSARGQFFFIGLDYQM